MNIIFFFLNSVGFPFTIYLIILCYWTIPPQSKPSSLRLRQIKTLGFCLRFQDEAFIENVPSSLPLNYLNSGPVFFYCRAFCTRLNSVMLQHRPCCKNISIQICPKNTYQTLGSFTGNYKTHWSPTYSYQRRSILPALPQGVLLLVYQQSKRVRLGNYYRHSYRQPYGVITEAL